MTRLLAAAWAACVLALSTVPIAAGYAAWWAMPVLIGCVILPTVLVLMGRRLSIPAAWVALGVGAVALIGGVALATNGSSAGAEPSTVPGIGMFGPLVDAIPRLLTAPRPAPAQLDYLVVPAMLVWAVALATALGSTVRTSTTRGHARVAPLIGALILQGGGALLTAGAGDASGGIAATSIAVLLLGWVALPAQAATASGPRRTSRTAWPAAAIAAVIIGALALPAAAMTTGDRFEPRALVPPPQLPAEATNPLPNVALWNSRADETLFTVTSSTRPAPERIRLAVLPDFDGAAWTLEGHLRPVGVVDSPDLKPGHWQRTLTYRLAPESLTGAWLPSLGRATKVSDAGVLMDADTGVLVAADGGIASQDVVVTTTMDAAPDDAIARAGVPPESDAARYLRLPRFPVRLEDAAHEATDGEPTRWDQVTALADYVGSDRILDEGAAGGASYGRISEFLFADKAQGGQVGTTEQFAASFAVLARAVGIPSRLVAGFDLTGDERKGDTTTVTGADARVWAQVYLARVGWVTVDPSPDSSIRTEHTPPEATAQKPHPTPAASSPAKAQARSHDDEDAAATPAPWWPAVGAALVLSALVVALVIVLWRVGSRARRRRSWRAAGAEGAWALVLDAAHGAHRAPPPGATPDEVADVLASGLPGHALALHELAAHAQERAFAPDDTHRDRRAGADWGSALDVERALRRTAPWHRRILWPLRRPARQPVQASALAPASTEPSA